MKRRQIHIVIEDETEAGLKEALDIAVKEIKAGYREGGNRRATGRYTYDVQTMDTSDDHHSH